MKLFNKSLLVLGLFPAIVAVTTVQADLPKAFDYNKASANYVDNTSGDNGGVSNPYYFGGTIGPSEGGNYCSGATNCEDKDTAWKLFGGYKFTDKISAEAAYVSLGDLHKGTGATSTNSDVSAMTVNAVGTIPVTEQFDVFGKVGAMRWSSDNSAGDESGFGATYGVGAKMHLNETTKLRAEWEKFPGIETGPSEKTDINMLSIGVELSTY